MEFPIHTSPFDLASKLIGKQGIVVMKTPENVYYAVVLMADNQLVITPVPPNMTQPDATGNLPHLKNATFKEGKVSFDMSTARLEQAHKSMVDNGNVLYLLSGIKLPNNEEGYLVLNIVSVNNTYPKVIPRMYRKEALITAIIQAETQGAELTLVNFSKRQKGSGVEIYSLRGETPFVTFVEQPKEKQVAEEPKGSVQRDEPSNQLVVVPTPSNVRKYTEEEFEFERKQTYYYNEATEAARRLVHSQSIFPAVSVLRMITQKDENGITKNTTTLGNEAFLKLAYRTVEEGLLQSAFLDTVPRGVRELVTKSLAETRILLNRMSHYSKSKISSDIPSDSPHLVNSVYTVIALAEMSWLLFATTNTAPPPFMAKGIRRFKEVVEMHLAEIPPEGKNHRVNSVIRPVIRGLKGKTTRGSTNYTDEVENLRSGAVVNPQNNVTLLKINPTSPEAIGSAKVDNSIISHIPYITYARVLTFVGLSERGETAHLHEFYSSRAVLSVALQNTRANTNYVLETLHAHGFTPKGVLGRILGNARAPKDYLANTDCNRGTPRAMVRRPAYVARALLASSLYDIESLQDLAHEREALADAFALTVSRNSVGELTDTLVYGQVKLNYVIPESVVGRHIEAWDTYQNSFSCRLSPVAVSSYLHALTNSKAHLHKRKTLRVLAALVSKIDLTTFVGGEEAFYAFLDENTSVSTMLDVDYSVFIANVKREYALLSVAAKREFTLLSIFGFRLGKHSLTTPISMIESGGRIPFKNSLGGLSEELVQFFSKVTGTRSDFTNIYNH